LDQLLKEEKYPFYATQWHPERNSFSWSRTEALDKSPSAISAMSAVSQFFITETRKNNHTFPSPKDEQETLIYNYNPTYTGYDEPYADEMTYYFTL